MSHPASSSSRARRPALGVVPAFALAAVVLVLSAPSARAQRQVTLNPERALTQYALDHWGRDAGLPQNSVTAIVRGADGFLWLGTQEGLVRFDGLRFRVFDKDDSALPHDFVHALAVAADGSLWIGTEGGLTRYHAGRFTIYTEADGLPSDRVSSLAAAPDGSLWIGTDDAGAARFADGRFERVGAEQGVSDPTVNAVAVQADGTVWLGLRDGLAFSPPGRAPDGRRAFATLAALDGTVISRLVADDAHVWVGTQGEGLVLLRGGEVTSRHRASDGLPGDKVLDLHPGADGVVWVGFDGGGVARLRRDGVEAFGSADGLVHDVVRAVYDDGAGSLWIGTDGGGLHRLRGSKFDVFTTREGLSSDLVATVLETRDGALWVGTEGGGVNHVVDGAATRYTTADGFPHDQVFGLAETRDGSVWIGTGGGGLVRHLGGRFRTYTEGNGLPAASSDIIYGLYADREDRLWASTGGGLVRLGPGAFDGAPAERRLFTKDDGLSSTLVTVVKQDARGDVWVGTMNAGLNRMRGDAVVEHIGAAEGLASETVLSLHPDGDALWIGTNEGGLYRLRDGRLDLFNMDHGLPDDTVFEILEDRRGHLWMTSNHGLFSVAKAELEAVARGDTNRVAATHYDERDGLANAEFFGGSQPAGWKGRDGRLWLPGAGGGVVSVDPQDVPRDLVPPGLAVERIVAGEDRIPFAGEALTIAPGPRRFEIHYAGASFLAPEEVTYEYRLRGADDAWVAAGDRREAYFMNLAPGPYTFEVRARNADGVWSAAPATLSFHLQPFFWQTVWFKALLVLLGALAVFGGFRLRVRQLEAHRRELEAQVVARTRDLSEAKDRIEAQADQLREMDRIKTRFFANISHEFRTPLTLNIGPLENALTGVYGPVSAPMQQQLSIMLRNARRLLRLINQLLDLSKLESGRMALRTETADLAGFVEGVVFSFTAFAERKNLDLDFESTPAVVQASFDPESMEKVFFNLLSNAVKFTPAGGRIEVSVRAGEGRDGEDAVYAHVRDTGQGIPAADLPHIFDRFHQVDGSVSDVQEGTGIGLSLVKELVELHGGTIEVESAPGEGTTFLLRLPTVVAPPAPPTAPPSGTPTAATGDGWEGAANASAAAEVVSRGPMVEMAVFDDEEDSVEATSVRATADADAATILIVDDQRDIRDYMVSCLQGRYHLRIARDGREALEVARAEPPDLILSDVMMPRLSGYALCAALEADPVLRHVPVILLTAKASIDEKVEGLKAGADDYLTKPFNARELLARVENLLNLHRHRQALEGLNGELQTLNADLLQANDALGRANELKSEFLRIAAHDLRTPLTSIRGCASVVKDELAAEHGSHELLDLILDSSQRMKDLITQILEAEALESGEMTFEMKAVELGTLAHAVAEGNAAVAAAKDQRIVVRPPAGPAWVRASELWLREACENLVSNAVKYSPLGAEITLEVVCTEGRVQFRVHDEGPGILPEDRPRLFKKFQRLSARPTANEASTGLGLSIAKQIVDAHDGRVWVDSEPGEGSTFVVEVAEITSPAAEEASTPA